MYTKIFTHRSITYHFVHPHCELLESVLSVTMNKITRRLYSTAARSLLEKQSDDIVLLSAVRSPIGRAFKGVFKDARPEDILIPVGIIFLAVSIV